MTCLHESLTGSLPTYKLDMFVMTVHLSSTPSLIPLSSVLEKRFANREYVLSTSANVMLNVALRFHIVFIF